VERCRDQADRRNVELFEWLGVQLTTMLEGHLVNTGEAEVGVVRLEREMLDMLALFKAGNGRGVYSVRSSVRGLRDLDLS
jgi:hypothetical protein